MIQVQLVLSSLVAVAAAAAVEQVIQVELVVTEVEPFCFMQRKSSSIE